MAEHVKHLVPDAQLDVQPGTWGGGMHDERATTEAEIGYSPQVALEEVLRHNINALRTKSGLPALEAQHGLVTLPVHAPLVGGMFRTSLWRLDTRNVCTTSRAALQAHISN